ncbi:MAG: hypothetical protein ACW96U_06535 [Candidatus Heimdallarchaeaceae archaeon]|jgi:hypothetical protein
MRKSVKALLSVFLIALVVMFVTVIVLGLFNAFTMFLLIMTPLVLIFGTFFLVTSQDWSESEFRRFRAKALEKRRALTEQRLLQASLQTKASLSDQSVDAITCYNCKDIFIARESVCDKCGAPKPNCIVCGLDLIPEIDPSDEVIISPCCSVYVHTEHILEWLEIKEVCPNCKRKITKEDLILPSNFNN